MEHARDISHSDGCTPSASLSRTALWLRAQLTGHREPLSKEIRAAVRETLQRVIDDLQFYADEIEMQRLPTRDGANAVRMVAGLIALQRQLT